MSRTVCYLQGGPCDLQKLVLEGQPRPEIYMAHMEQPTIDAGTLADAARLAACKKLIYQAVGGYTVQGNHIATYAYAGLLPEIVIK